MDLTYINSAVTLIAILSIQCYYSYGACPSLISNETLTVTCKHNNKSLENCDNPIDGTEAYIICNRFYEEDSLEANPKLLCREGRWDGHIPQCYPICGKTHSKESSNTEEAYDMILNYPWHVQVYHLNNTYQCGGTLIAMNMVITAAHCVTVYNSVSAHFEPVRILTVISGKYYFSVYYDESDKFIQNSKVQEVYFPREYDGYAKKLAFDIAILVLASPFRPSEVVQPVCLNFQSFDNSLLQDRGLVVGWDYAIEQSYSIEILKIVTVSYIPYRQCHSKLNSSFWEELTFDKICGLYLDISSENILCHKDYGGGFVLKNKINGRYYITGVLSNVPYPSSSTDFYSCDLQLYNLYTSIYQHRSFLKDLTENHEMKNCRLPNHPSHGQYVFFDTNVTLAYELEQQVPTHSMLTLTCDAGYNFTSPSATQYYCSRNGQWKPALTGCTQIAFDQPTVLDQSTSFNYNYVILIISAIVMFVALVAIILYKLKYKQEWELQREIKLAGLDRFHNGNLKRFNPELDIGDQAEILPYNKNFEFPRDKLILGKQLGFGAFGIVMQADAFGIIKNEERTVVAVKTAKSNADYIQMKALTSELKIMVHLGKHLNIVNLLGACTQNITKRELLIIVEYCQFGNLYNYLLRNRENYIDQIDNVTGDIDYTFGTDNLANALAVPNNLSTSREIESINSICTKDLVSWSFQVARGMEYLASRKIFHGDLAARNILLAHNNIVKICDFGLAKRLYQALKYKKKQNCPLPIKWMAVESIQDQIFSTQSDVWSFGIVLWEFFSLAQTPYPGMEADEKLYYKLLDGYKMEAPQYAPKEMYKIMCDCWSINPASRPCFNKLAGRIGLMLEENVRQHYIDLNDLYLVMNTQRLNENQPDYLEMLSPHNSRHTVAIQGDHAVATSGYLCLTSSDSAINEDVKSVVNEPKVVDGECYVLQ